MLSVLLGGDSKNKKGEAIAATSVPPSGVEKTTEDKGGKASIKNVSEKFFNTSFGESRVRTTRTLSENVDLNHSQKRMNFVDR